MIYLCKTASKVKHVRRGVKEVSKALRKGEKGLVVIAGDISPMDVIAHLPVLCEDYNIPYVFVPSKEQLGEASSTKRPTSVTMIVFGGKSKDEKAAADYKELYDECFAAAKDLVCLLCSHSPHGENYIYMIRLHRTRSSFTNCIILNFPSF